MIVQFHQSYLYSTTKKTAQNQTLICCYSASYKLLQTTNTSLSPSKIPPTPSTNSSEQKEFIRTKQVFERLFPDIPSKNVEYDAWLDSLSTHIEHLQQQEQQHITNQPHSNKRKTTTTTTTNIANHQNGADNDGDDDDNSSDENITGNGTHHYNQDNGLKLSPSTSEELVLQNAQLKSTVDEYKLIVAETVSASDFV